ncbi:MAG: coenzyme F420-0:L-glutamate ligase [Sterolibacterium sp.]|nr:coenzyme F420-0:L-glutamate ligase [Sterolibacterium sp.]
MKAAGISFSALQGIADVKSGDDLAALLAAAMPSAANGDVLVVAQKIVSKAEGSSVNLNTVSPSARALELAAITGKDPRLVEVVLSESSEVLRAKPDVLIVRHRLGYVVANAGIDRSNVRSPAGEEHVLLLPRDADASAAALRAGLQQRLGLELGIVISDSFGRPWRNGVVNVALGVAGLPALVDCRGELDLYGRKLEVTQVALADALAAAAGLLMGEGAEGQPAVLAQGLIWTAPARPAQALLRPLAEDLFR